MNDEMTAALARLDASLKALADTRDTVLRTLDHALNDLTRTINELDVALETPTTDDSFDPFRTPTRTAD